MEVYGESIGDAYFAALSEIMGNGSKGTFDPESHYITVHCSKPVRSLSAAPKSGKHVLDVMQDVRKWEQALNLNDAIYKAFSQFRFCRPDGNTGDASGLGWINGRCKSLFDDAEGYYREALVRAFGLDQIEAIVRRLSARDKNGERIHGGSANGLHCQIYVPQVDLMKSCNPRPRMANTRCLTYIAFKPIGGTLHLHAGFRSQYFDVKAYGNFITLAMLLSSICRRTGYQPGSLTSKADKIVFHDRRDARSLYCHLRSRPEKVSTVFAYGSIMEPKVIRRLIGRVPRMQKATLPGFNLARHGVKKFSQYRVAVPRHDSEVVGKLLLDLTKRELAKIHEWEMTPERIWGRKMVAVSLGSKKVNALAYLANRKFCSQISDSRA